MGGCRCSYSNCIVKSDGKTHLFHYPVFDKVRCHKWLTNAGRLDLLNITVAQLKNRVICQHHFEDNMFMNYKKDKLRYDAIPTLVGPFCECVKQELKQQQVYISLDDIEREINLNDKKANFKMKYVDFLTNGEYVEVEQNPDLASQTNQIISRGADKATDYEFLEFVEKKIQSNQVTDSHQEPSSNQLIEVHPGNETNLSSTNFNQLGYLHPYLFDLQSKSLQPCDDLLLNKTHVEINDVTSLNLNPKKNKIQIIEDKICSPIPFTGKLRPISPSKVLRLHVPNETEISVPKLNNTIKETEDSYVAISLSNDKHIAAETAMSPKISEVVPRSLQQSSIDNGEKLVRKHHREQEFSQISRLSYKFKMTAERLAAIEEKRRFNMKLKDVIQLGLTHIEEDEQNKSTKNNVLEEVKTCNSTGTTTEKYQDYTVSCIEASMKRMESALLNKIEQNSQRITALVDTFQNNSNSKNRHKSTQTLEDSYIKYLYQEISKFLSPNLKNLLYEELFINNSLLKERTKRRKLR